MKKTTGDWNDVKKRWAAWWNCDVYDRVVLQVTAPKDHPQEPSQDLLKGDRIPETKWADMDQIISRAKYELENTFYGAEVIPVLNPQWSVGHACYFGCTPHFSEDTVWVDPLLPEPDDYNRIAFDASNQWWKWFQDFTDKALKRFGSDCYLVPQFGNSANDTLALIRESQQLMVDTIENPEWVKAALEMVTDSLLGAFEEIWNKITPIYGNDYVNWNGSWSPGRSIIVDSDMSCMLSPGQFKQLYLPSIIKQMHTVEYREYHLDGEMAARIHLDTLLDLPELQAIQWVPGGGREEILQWVPLLQKIQSKKKAVKIYTKPDEVIPVIKELRPEGLCISTCCSSENEARKLIEQVERLF